MLADRYSLGPVGEINERIPRRSGIREPSAGRYQTVVWGLQHAVHRDTPVHFRPSKGKR